MRNHIESNVPVWQLRFFSHIKTHHSHQKYSNNMYLQFSDKPLTFFFVFPATIVMIPHHHPIERNQISASQNLTFSPFISKPFSTLPRTVASRTISDKWSDVLRCVQSATVR